MTDRIKINRIIHTIHAVTDIAKCRALYLDMLGGLIFAEGLFAAEDRDMALLYVSNHMIEPMSPCDVTRDDKAFARYVQRYGQGWHSFEIGVDSASAAATHFRSHGSAVTADMGIFHFVKQDSTGGVLLEVCERPMPNDPYDRRGWNPHWSDGHPSTIAALDHIACISGNADQAISFFTGQCDGILLSDVQVQAPQAARHVMLRLGDTNVAFIQPDSSVSGPLGAFLQPPCSGIYALVWRVENESAAQTWLESKGLRTTREGCVSGGFAVEPDDFLGARHEFVAG